MDIEKRTNSEAVPMVVTLSGVLKIEEIEGMTADSIVDFTLGQWGIARDMVEAPFVAVHDKVSRKHRPVEGNALIGPVDPQKQVIRVVLPLKQVEVSTPDTRQMLLES